MGLNGDARAPRDGRPISQSLGALQVARAVEPVARVDDDTRLVGPQLGADASELARQRSDDGILWGLVDEKVSVVALACTASATVSGEFRRARGMTQLDAGLAGKVVDAAGASDANLSGGEGAVVGNEVAFGVGQM